ncbi:hypothetical protein LPTSP4_01740 [Leptospira ryugenii]|uniref:Uncharacterized protein n=1 Tax=Leptospira ryugenii TaxID=1917863 RepID=A0A2P2DVM8_9LEPT|nr:hypothetical protein [Leptospira ryugenii]GBF48674.1 hypothetical protein LPTSP4_01740 [Leptospira ryugenii]
MNVYLGDQKISTYGRVPKPGDSLEVQFSLPWAWNTKSRLRPKSIQTGLVIVSTLPNIKSNECSMQVLSLEEEVNARKIKAKIFHVASDKKSNWKAVVSLHPFLKAKGYILEEAEKDDVETFKQALGVGVKGSKRIVHGLFAFLDGKLIKSYIPRQQYGIPNIKRFLDAIQRSFH